MPTTIVRPPLAASADVNCSQLVPTPIDASPIRSPQALHAHIAARVRGHTVVEVGTRNGDGIACMAQTAARAVAIEASSPYCVHLRRRASTLPGGVSFSVICTRYQRATLPAAEFYTWWQQWPHLTDAALLAHLRKEQLAGRVSRTAVALIAFDLSWSMDRRSWRSLSSRAVWAQRLTQQQCPAVPSNPSLPSVPSAH